MLDRVGRLQLPDEFTKTLDLRERVRLALETDHVGVWPGHRPAKAAPPVPPAASDAVVAPAPVGPSVPLPPRPQATPAAPAAQQPVEAPRPADAPTEEES